MIQHTMSIQQVRERAKQLEAVFDAMVDGVFVYDREGHFVQMNAAGRKLLEHCLPPGYETRPLEQRFARVVAFGAQGKPLSRERLPASRILAGEVLTPANAADVMLRKIDGQTVYLSITGGPLYDTHGQLIGAVAIARDITEGHRLEQLERRIHAETEARLALLQLVLDELPSSVYLVRGSDARLVLANRTATTVWGATWAHNQPMSEFLKENDIRIVGMEGKVLAPEQFATLRALRSGEPVYQHQESIRHPDGTTLPVLVNAVTLDASHLFSSSAESRKRLAEGAEPAALVMHQDVTALKEAERLKDEFIAIAAHELRNPLAVLKGYAQTLLFQARQEKGSQVDEWQQEALHNIDKATLRLVELTEDLLDATRLQAGRLELYPEPTDLVALARRVVKRLQTTTEQHRLSLCTSLEYLVVCADARRIEQVLTNLISNAIKYSPAGGPIEVAVWEESGTREAVLSVRDCGIGISTEQQARIFGRFARAENARKIGGTGLGLYICRALVEQHSGRIWFESVEGTGSTFFVALPSASEAVSLC
jgi:PAS domain S-box-containing protein